MNEALALLVVIEGVQFGIIGWLCRSQLRVFRRLTIVALNLKRHMGDQWTEEDD